MVRSARDDPDRSFSSITSDFVRPRVGSLPYSESEQGVQRDVMPRPENPSRKLIKYLIGISRAPSASGGEFRFCGALYDRRESLFGLRNGKWYYAFVPQTVEPFSINRVIIGKPHRHQSARKNTRGGSIDDIRA